VAIRWLKKFEDMFIGFDRMYESDRHIDTHTHRMTAQAALA